MFFTWLYEILHPIQPDPTWSSIYELSGWCLVSITLLVSAYYYHVLNRYFINWFKLRHWILFLLINSILSSFVVTIIAWDMLQAISFMPEILSFFFINFLYSAIFYSLISYIMRLGSPHAKYTPYKLSRKRNIA